MFSFCHNESKLWGCAYWTRLLWREKWRPLLRNVSDIPVLIKFRRIWNVLSIIKISNIEMNNWWSFVLTVYVSVRWGLLEDALWKLMFTRRQSETEWRDGISSEKSCTQWTEITAHRLVQTAVCRHLVTRMNTFARSFLSVTASLLFAWSLLFIRFSRDLMLLYPII